MNLRAAVENVSNKIANVFRNKEDRLLTKEILFENVKNQSRAQKLAVALFGPTAKAGCKNEIDNGPGRAVVSYTDEDGEVHTFVGDSGCDAFVKASQDLTLREIQEICGPTLVSLEVAQSAVDANTSQIALTRLAMMPRGKAPNGRRERCRARRAADRAQREQQRQALAAQRQLALSTDGF